MSVVLTKGGKITTGSVICETEWDFISKYLDDYSRDEQVALSNDICVVLEVIGDGHDPYEYMKVPENERDFSDIPFDNVSEYVDDLRDVDALHKLLTEVDNDLFQRALRDYYNNHSKPNF